jgi:creatinine amidohydrolase
MNWMQVEDYLRHDDRAVLPIGSTEQHAYLRPRCASRRICAW